LLQAHAKQMFGRDCRSDPACSLQGRVQFMNHLPQRHQVSAVQRGRRKSSRSATQASHAHMCGKKHMADVCRSSSSCPLSGSMPLTESFLNSRPLRYQRNWHLLVCLAGGSPVHIGLQCELCIGAGRRSTSIFAGGRFSIHIAATHLRWQQIPSLQMAGTAPSEQRRTRDDKHQQICKMH